jgi:hypothetical protein
MVGLQAVAGFEDSDSTELAKVLPDVASRRFRRRGEVGRTSTKRLVKMRPYCPPPCFHPPGRGIDGDPLPAMSALSGDVAGYWAYYNGKKLRFIRFKAASLISRPFSIVPELVELAPGFGGVCIRHRTQPGILKGLNG